MRYSKHWTLLLLCLILLVYLLQFRSQTLKIKKKKKESVSEWTSMSRLNLNRFKKRSQKLRTKVDKIASRRNKRFLSEETTEEVIKQSRTIIYNRIDKAGSTTMISISCRELSI